MGVEQHWPLFELRVVTPRVELRYPSDDDIAEIAERAAVLGVYDPDFMPFTVAWTDVEPPLQQRYNMQYHWSLRANWKPELWNCNLVAVVEGRIVGCQSAGASDFATMRTALTGSYLFLPEQGKGVGTEMRAAILHLLFAGLNADYAETAAMVGNDQSLGVTAKLGYEPTGHERVLSRGAARELLRFRMPRATWETRRRDDITIAGLDPVSNCSG